MLTTTGLHHPQLNHFIIVCLQDECSEAQILVNLLRQISNSSQHRLVALVAAGCVSATEAIAKIAHYHNITLVNVKVMMSVLTIFVIIPPSYHRFPVLHHLVS